jgi:hypothetical protein
MIKFDPFVLRYFNFKGDFLSLLILIKKHFLSMETYFSVQKNFLGSYTYRVKNTGELSPKLPPLRKKTIRAKLRVDQSVLDFVGKIPFLVLPKLDPIDSFAYF